MRTAGTGVAVRGRNCADYAAWQGMKADGTPDRRYRASGAKGAGAPSGGEASGTRGRARVAAPGGGGGGAPSGLRGGPRKADGTPDRRYRANRGSQGSSGGSGGGDEGGRDSGGGSVYGGAGGGGSGGGGAGGGGGGEGGGSGEGSGPHLRPSPPPLPPPSPPLPPPFPPLAGAKRRQDTTSRWQPRALDEYDTAVKVARRDGVT